MRTVIPLAFVLLAILNLPSIIRGAKAQSPGDGLSATEFRNFAKSLPRLPGRIQAIRLFNESSGEKSSVAVATWGERSGWRLFVFGSRKGQNFQLEWKSGRLDDTFAVGDPSSLRAFNFLDGTEGISFEGCLRHNCPDVFSILLYVPSLRTAFTATSVYRKVTYSSDMRLPEDEKYKSVLDQLVDEQTQFVQKLEPRKH